MRHILSVKPKEDYILHLTFDGNEERLFDLKPYFKGSLFVPLKNEELFKKVRVSQKPRGLIWPNGADLCADMLYMNSRPHEAKDDTVASGISHMTRQRTPSKL
jgi:hypothetical protein